MRHHMTNDGGRSAAVPFRDINVVDFEYNTAGGRSDPVCMCVLELRSGRQQTFWREDLRRMRAAPFNTGEDAVMISYVAQAEAGSMLSLGWPLPKNVIDLFAEHRVETNGMRLPFGNGLTGALAHRGLPRLASEDKSVMRQLILEKNAWTQSEIQAIRRYCESDVFGLATLFGEMAPRINWTRAAFRGSYSVATAIMESNGIPVDRVAFEKIKDSIADVRRSLIEEAIDRFDVFEGTNLSRSKFEAWLDSVGVQEWPHTPSGLLQTSAGTIDDMTGSIPVLRGLPELLKCLNTLKLFNFEVGADARARASLWAYASKTGRNGPSPNRFLFGAAKPLRSLARPAEGHGLAYIDFSSSEFGIAAGRSGDARMREAYDTGDPYMAFAKQAKLVPMDATATSHKLVRDKCKAVVLGQQYGMGPSSLARSAGLTPAEAVELIDHHKRTYADFWKWMQNSTDRAVLHSSIETEFGWRMHVTPDTKATSLMNFPMQATGAELLRLSGVVACDEGIEVCAPVHDAFLIHAPLDQLDEKVRAMREIMTEAGKVVANGVAIRTDAKVVRFPDRYVDEGAAPMWNRIVRKVGLPEASVRES